MNDRRSGHLWFTQVLHTHFPGHSAVLCLSMFQMHDSLSIVDAKGRFVDKRGPVQSKRSSAINNLSDKAGAAADYGVTDAGCGQNATQAATFSVGALGSGLPYTSADVSAEFSTASSFDPPAHDLTPSETFICKFCFHTFPGSSELKVHMRLHSKLRSFLCKVCNKSFLSSSDLRRHERIHTGERPFSCKFCNKRFNQASTVRIHERIHTGDRPYVCKCCGKRFSNSSCLRKHERTHTNDSLLFT